MADLSSTSKTVREGVPLVTLNNGVQMPQLGLGVWQIPEGEEVESAVAAALNYDYRLIDTAAAYGNETGVGNAVRASGLSREEVFVTTKVWNSDHGYDNALHAFDHSLKKLGLEYIDLYLIHWPLPTLGKYVETWRAMERIYEERRARAIGVSNFLPHHLRELLNNCSVIPAVNQIELHPRLQQHKTRELCASYDIQIESWSPIMRGQDDLLQDPVIRQIAREYGKTSAQTVIRWHIQSGFVVIPKSAHAERIRENIDVFDFELSSDDMEAINAMDLQERVGPHPDSF